MRMRIEGGAGQGGDEGVGVGVGMRLDDWVKAGIRVGVQNGCRYKQG